MIPEQVLQELDDLKSQGKYKEALAITNRYLVKNPQNKEALYQVADIEFRSGQLNNSQKPIDYLVASDAKDPMGRYLKGVIAMEKTDWELALDCFQRAYNLEPDVENPEIFRCLGLAMYRTDEQSRGLEMLTKAYLINNVDAEILLNLVELYILEKNYPEATKYVDKFFNNYDDIMFFDRDKEYYDTKFAIFAEYLEHIS